ncbi:MAG: hypothetical protein AB7F75_06570 [Planctomycetota bacterium]
MNWFTKRKLKSLLAAQTADLAKSALDAILVGTTPLHSTSRLPIREVKETYRNLADSSRQILGLDEALSSLAKQNCESVKIHTLESASRTHIMITDPSVKTLFATMAILKGVTTPSIAEAASAPARTLAQKLGTYHVVRLARGQLASLFDQALGALGSSPDARNVAFLFGFPPGTPGGVEQEKDFGQVEILENIGKVPLYVTALIKDAQGNPLSRVRVSGAYNRFTILAETATEAKSQEVLDLFVKALNLEPFSFAAKE